MDPFFFFFFFFFEEKAMYKWQAVVEILVKKDVLWKKRH